MVEFVGGPVDGAIRPLSAFKQYARNGEEFPSKIVIPYRTWNGFHGALYELVENKYRFVERVD